MAYRNFKFEDLENKFGINQQKTILFAEKKEVFASTWLLETLQIGLENPLLSEKAIGENLISPILTEIKRKNKTVFELFSGVNLLADRKKGLNGECDFLFAKAPQSVILKAPIFCVTEAKRGEVNNPNSLAQCAAQLLGARIFNKNSNKNLPIIYGSVTTGTEWLFLKLEDDLLLIDTERYVIADLPKLLGVLQTIVDFYK